MRRPTLPPRRAELSTQVNRAKGEHEERKSTVLDKSQKEHLLAEKTRMEDNIKRMQQVRPGRASPATTLAHA